jgi:DNA recombination-dependent growth factor C
MLVMNFTTQSKKPKKSEVDKRVKLLSAAHEEEFGVPPTKNELADMVDQVTFELLPLTFADAPKHQSMFIEGAKLYVEGSYKQAEESTAALRKVVGSLPIELVETAKDVTGELTRFIGKSIADKLTLKDKCTLLTQEERKITVAKSLYYSEAQDIVEQGAVVSSVELEFDGVMKFTLKDDLSFTGIKFYDDLTGELEEGDEVGTTIIKLCEVVKMVDEVLFEMGGLLED